MNNEVDLENLEIALKNSMAEDSWDDYDFDKICGEYDIINDGTGIYVNCSDFYAIVDINTYEVIDMKGSDVKLTQEDLNYLEEIKICH